MVNNLLILQPIIEQCRFQLYVHIITPYPPNPVIHQIPHLHNIHLLLFDDLFQLSRVDVRNLLTRSLELLQEQGFGDLLLAQHELFVFYGLHDEVIVMGDGGLTDPARGFTEQGG